MLGQVPETPYDLRFTALGIPVRIHPVFWLTSAFLAWSPGRLDVVIIRILCILVAILVHELGHAVVTRHFGWTPEIVLYFLGGYATTMRHSTWRDIAVSAAGPGAGFVLFFSIWFWGRVSGVITDGSSFLRPEFSAAAMRDWPSAIAVGTKLNNLILDAIYFSLFINLIWNVANLLPVLPLDGGQISREFFSWLRPRDGMDICLMLSMVASGAVALWSAKAMSENRGVMGLDPLFLAIMFGYLCFQSYQAWQASRSGYW